jgi:hypothetical protein
MGQPASGSKFNKTHFQHHSLTWLAIRQASTGAQVGTVRLFLPDRILNERNFDRLERRVYWPGMATIS